MTRKVYKSAMGKPVDLGSLILQNEGVRAVGNMNVNARGDVVGTGGKIVKTKEQLMKEYYEAPKGQADDTPVRRTRPENIEQQEVVRTQVINPVAQSTEAKSGASKTTTVFKPKQGIDAALDGIE